MNRASTRSRLHCYEEDRLPDGPATGRYCWKRLIGDIPKLRRSHLVNSLLHRQEALVGNQSQLHLVPGDKPLVEPKEQALHRLPHYAVKATEQFTCQFIVSIRPPGTFDY